MGKERVFSVFGVRFYVLFEVSGKIVRGEIEIIWVSGFAVEVLV